MIIARAATKDGGELLILGITPENINRIIDNHPLYLTRETHGDGIPEGWKIVILYGESQLGLEELMVKAGVIGPDTKIHLDPRLVDG